MDLFLPYPNLNYPQKIRHQDKVFLMGSCFTENIGHKLAGVKVDTLMNPTGIMYNPISIQRSLELVLSQRLLTQQDLFQQNGVWNSWDFHSVFSGIEIEDTLEVMNASLSQAFQFLKQTDWVILTLGTAFYYLLKSQNGELKPVANCHKVPQFRFEKQLIGTQEMVEALQESLNQIKKLNPKAKFIFTVSPIRHTRDGIIENSRSKARLLEAVHQLVEERTDAYYFPSYEIMMDILRDYRFYKDDLIHPSTMSQEIIWEQFCAHFFDKEDNALMEKILQLQKAVGHRPQKPNSAGYQDFLKQTLFKIEELERAHPYLDFENERRKLQKRVLS